MSARYLGRFQTDPFVLALVGTVSVATLIPYQGEIRPSGGGHRLSRDRCARPCAGRQCREPPRLDAVARSLDRPYHDPFVLFGFLAGCTNIGDFSTQVLILAQRQTVLVAKQAACLDVFQFERAGQCPVICAVSGDVARGFIAFLIDWAQVDGSQ